MCAGRVARNWYVVVVAIIVAVVLVLVLTVGGGKQNQAQATVSLGRPLSPTGTSQISSPLVDDPTMAARYKQRSGQ